MRYPYHGPTWGPGWMVFGWLIPLLLFGALIAVAVWAILRLGPRPQRPFGAPPAWQGPPRGDAALEAARLRYARGEISREDYTRLVLDLGGQPPHPAQAPPPTPPPGPPPAPPQAPRSA